MITNSCNTIIKHMIINHSKCITIMTTITISIENSNTCSNNNRFIEDNHIDDNNNDSTTTTTTTTTTIPYNNNNKQQHTVTITIIPLPHS